MEAAETKLYSEIVKSPPKPSNTVNNTEKIVEPKKDNTVENAITAAKMKVGIKPITIDDLDRIAEAKKVKGEQCLYFAVAEFLTEELKMDQAEIEGLGKFTVSRRDDPKTP